MTQIHIPSLASYNTDKDTDVELITPISPEPRTVQLSPSSPYHNDLVPSFEDILSGNSPAPYSRVAFANFLKKIHCLENLEFLIHSNYYLISQNNNGYDNDYKFKQWDMIYKNFISNDSPKEVNIPYDYKNELVQVFQRGELPSMDLISSTMIVIKDLLRDAYFQFISNVRKISINEHYKLQQKQHQLPTPTYEKDNGVEDYSPLDNIRSVSPLSCSDESMKIPPRSINNNSNTCAIKSDDSLVTTSECIEEDCSCFNDSKKSSFSSNKSTSISGGSMNYGGGGGNSNNNSNKNSISEVSKKIAGKLKWRRLSSNSS